MGNTLNGTIYTNIAQMGFKHYTQALAALRSFCTDFSNEVRAQGTSVQTRLFGAGAAAQDLVDDLSGDYDAAVSDTTTTAVTVNLDPHPITGFHFTDSEYNRIGSGVWNDILTNRVRSHAYVIAADVLGTVFALVTRANFGAKAVAVNVGDFDLDEMSDLRAAAVDAGWSWALNGIASCVLNGAYYTALTKDEGVRAKYASSADTLNSGILPNLLGFRTIEAPTLPANSEYLAGFIATPDAIAIAMRPPATQASKDYEWYEIMEDPETGVTMVYAAVFNRRYRRIDHTFETLYGAAVGNPAALKRLTTASGS